MIDGIDALACPRGGTFDGDPGDLPSRSRPSIANPSQGEQEIVVQSEDSAERCKEMEIARNTVRDRFRMWRMGIVAFYGLRPVAPYGIFVQVLAQRFAPLLGNEEGRLFDCVLRFLLAAVATIFVRGLSGGRQRFWNGCHHFGCLEHRPRRTLTLRIDQIQSVSQKSLNVMYAFKDSSGISTSCFSIVSSLYVSFDVLRCTVAPRLSDSICTIVPRLSTLRYSLGLAPLSIEVLPCAEIWKPITGSEASIDLALLGPAFTKTFGYLNTTVLSASRGIASSKPGERAPPGRCCG